jgi:hypothetical protein
MPQVSMYGPEFAELRAKARAKIKVEELPSSPNMRGAQLGDIPDSPDPRLRWLKRVSFCGVCGGVIEQGSLIWYRFEPPETRHETDLHQDCYLAWMIEAGECERRAELEHPATRLDLEP